MHIGPTWFKNGAFNGLHKITALYMTNSSILHQKEMNGFILETGTFPKLEKRVLVGIRHGLYLNEIVWKEIEAGLITYLDISYIQAYKLDLNATAVHCTHIRILRGRGLVVGHMNVPSNYLNQLSSLEVLDLSDNYFTGKMACMLHTLFNSSSVTVRIGPAKVISNTRDLYLDK